jgi:hypothetical protein
MRREFLAIDDPRWPEALRRLRHDLYHRPEYGRLDGLRLNATPEAFLASDGPREFFVPYLVRRCDPVSAGAPETWDVVSSYGYPGILLSDAAREPVFVEDALAVFCDSLRGRGVCSAFLRMHPVLGHDFAELFPAGTLHDLGDTVVIDLSLDEQRLWKQTRESHRTNILKRQKQGFVARFVPLTEVLEEFLVIYTQTMDRVQAKEMYYFPRDYFTTLAGMDEVHCCIVETGSKIISACIFFETNGIIQYHLGGTLDEFLSQSPFHMIIHHGALWAKRRGNQWLHLGGGVGSANDSLLRFKSGFSPLRQRFQVARLITDEPEYLRLVALRAAALDSGPEALLATSYFPAYRATI